MGEEKKKPSSLRGRVDRARKTYSRKRNPFAAIAGVVVLTVMGIGLYVGLGGGNAPRTSAPREGDTGRAPSPVPGPATPVRTTTPANASVEDQIWKFTEQAKFDANADPDAALESLRGALGRWSSWPDVHHAMAMVVEKKIRKSGLARELSEEKLGYLEKAEQALQSGGKWAYDPNRDRSSNLRQSIEQARKDAGR